MKPEICNALAQLNTRFYERNAASFSQTRNAPWDGWRRCMAACGLDTVDAPMPNAATPNAPAPRTCSVLDIACGNLRFEAFLAGAFPQVDWSFFAIDNCEPLVETGQEIVAMNVHFTCEDIIGNLLEGLPAAEPANTPALAAAVPFDLVVSFGFLHHIPSFELRRQFLIEALNQVKPDGHLVVSFWQFMNDPSRRAKVEHTHAEALDSTHFGPDDLEPGDYLLGWKNEPGNYRYCHHFTGEEIDRLIVALEPHASVVESFSADGKTNNLNRYVVFKRIR